MKLIDRPVQHVQHTSFHTSQRIHLPPVPRGIPFPGSVDLLGVVFRGPAPRLRRFWRDACGWSARAAPAEQKLSLFLRAVSARAEQWMETAKMEAG